MVACVSREWIPAGYVWSRGLARGLESGEKKRDGQQDGFRVCRMGREMFRIATWARRESGSSNRHEIILEREMLADATTALYQP